MSLSMKAPAALLIAGACLFGASSAIAQAAAKPDPRLATFKANDKNKDGKLAKDEFSVVARSYGFGGAVDAVWAQSDKNKDSFLQEAEFFLALDVGNKSTTQVVTTAPTSSPPAGATSPQVAFAASDKNKDGKLTKTEFADFAKATGIAARTDAVFTVMDANKDLLISMAELDRVQGRMSTTDSLAATSSAPPGDGRPSMESFKANDKNKDGKLSKEEFLAMAKSLGAPPGAEEPVRAMADANKDNFVSEAEMAAMLASMGAGGGASVSVGGGGGAPAPTPDQRIAAFKASDKNKDGKLTKAEYTEVLKTLGYVDQLEEYWAQRDVNKDGFITDAEYRPAIAGGTAIPAGQ